LIVPVDSTQPNTAFGTSYDGEFSSTVTTAFNFDIPASYAGRTCTVVFLLPNKANLETSDYTISGAGGLHFQELVTPATTGTTYNNLPAVGGVDVTIPSVTPGNSYAVASHECGAGQRISFKVSATGNLALNYFQDYNPSPIGAYISVC
jgi:glucan endo-1,3-beta-D-glucosidase